MRLLPLPSSRFFDVIPGTQIVRVLPSLLFSALRYPTLVLLYRKHRNIPYQVGENVLNYTLQITDISLYPAFVF